MKKIIFILILSSILACKKNPIEQIMDDLEPVDLPQNIVGNWQWIESSGGFAGVHMKDSTRRQVLTIQKNNRFQLCVNDICNTGKWAYGSRILKSSNGSATKDTILVLNIDKSLFAQTVFNAKSIKDTLVLNDNCADCFSHIYMKAK
jgi:hypothetical protein